MQSLQAKLGSDVLEGATKAVSQKSALENLCRALQEENRRLSSATAAQEQLVYD